MIYDLMILWQGMLLYGILYLTSLLINLNIGKYS